MSLADARREYALAGLDEGDLEDDPVDQFRAWFEAAVEAGVEEPTAMTLATADAQGRPSARTVLLKGFGADGFRFFTNYQSRKGRELEANPRAALLFFWPQLDRQVRLEGAVQRLSPEESNAYFARRPRGSRLGAVASDQSRPITDRAVLEARLRELNQQYGDTDDIPRPPHWGGFSLLPEAFEFWQGRPSRLHDRFRYHREPSGAWGRERLSP